VGRQVATEWENRKRLAPGVTTPGIETLVDRARAAGAQGAKVCGAGGGGCIFFFGRPADMPAVREAVASSGARILDYRVDVDGLRVG
jgi:D-glycero-alpha-D-manno-heptose-7-phosphate kinase